MTHPLRDQKIGNTIRSFNAYKHYMITSSPQEIAAHNERIVQAKRDKILLKAARAAQQRNAWQNRKLAV